MIISRKGIVELSGSRGELTADLACIVSSIFKYLSDKLGEEGAKAFVNNAVEKGLWSDEQISKKAREFYSQKLGNDKEGLLDAIINSILKEREGK